MQVMQYSKGWPFHPFFPYEKEDMWWIIRLFLQNKIDTVKPEELFRDTAERGKLRSLEVLVDYGGVDPSADDNNALRIAAWNGHTSIVEYLCGLDVERGIDPSARENEALGRAAEAGRIDIVKLLCNLDASRGVDPSARNNHALRIAINRGHYNIVRFLRNLQGL